MEKDGLITKIRVNIFGYEYERNNTAVLNEIKKYPNIA
jgi:hypothetical protein